MGLRVVEDHEFCGLPVASHFSALPAASDTQGQLGGFRFWWDHAGKREQGDKQAAKAQAGLESILYGKRRISRETCSANGMY